VFAGGSENTRGALAAGGWKAKLELAQQSAVVAAVQERENLLCNARGRSTRSIQNRAAVVFSALAPQKKSRWRFRISRDSRIFGIFLMSFL
jgi:hypothetical protein